MTPSEALQWADKNCTPEAVDRLRSRAAVAVLAAEVRRMRHRIECLRGGLKSAAGWLLDADDMAGHEKCLEMAGDMEPPLTGPNAKSQATDAALSRQVACTDGLCGNGSEVGAGGTAVDIAQAPDIHAELTMAAFHRGVGK